MSDVKYLISVDAAGAIKSIKDFEGSINGSSDAAKRSETSHANLWKQIGLGEAAYNLARRAASEFKKVIEDSIKGAIDEEKSERMVASALETSGRTRAALLPVMLDFSQAMSKETLYTHEQVEASEALLIQMTDLDTNGLQRALRGAAGLADVMGIDLHSATMLIMKGMEGNTAALSRYGIKLDETLSPQQKQNELLNQLEGLYKRAEDAAKGYSGQLEMGKKYLDETKEALGKLIIEKTGFIGIYKRATEALYDYVTAQDVANAAEDRSTKASIDQENRLYKAMLTADATAKTFYELKNRFNENTAAMIYSITHEEKYAGIKQQVLLALRDVNAEQRKAAPLINETGNNMAIAADKTASLKKELGLTFNSDLEARIAMIQATLKAYKGQLSPESEQKLKNELGKLSDQMATGGLVADGMAQKFKNLEKPLKALAIVVTDDIDPAFKDMWPPIDFITNAMNKRAELLKASFYAFFNIIPPASKQAETALEAFAGKVEKILNGKIIPMYNVFYGQLMAISNQHQQNENINIDNEYKRRRELIDKSTADEKTKAAQILALDSEFEQKRRVVANKAAQSQKALAIAQATISLIEAEAKALTAAPPPWNFALMALVAAAGGVLIATIAAQPIPLAKGAIFKGKTQLTSGSGQTYDVAEAGEAEILSSSSRLREAIYGGRGGNVSGGSNRTIHVHVHNEIGGKLLNDQVIEIVQDASDTNRIKIKSRSVS